MTQQPAAVGCGSRGGTAATHANANGNSAQKASTGPGFTGSVSIGKFGEGAFTGKVDRRFCSGGLQTRRIVERDRISGTVAVQVRVATGKPNRILADEPSNGRVVILPIVIQASSVVLSTRVLKGFPISNPLEDAVHKGSVKSQLRPQNRCRGIIPASARTVFSESSCYVRRVKILTDSADQRVRHRSGSREFLQTLSPDESSTHSADAAAHFSSGTVSAENWLRTEIADDFIPGIQNKASCFPSLVVFHIDHPFRNLSCPEINSSRRPYVADAVGVGSPVLA